MGKASRRMMKRQNQRKQEQEKQTVATKADVVRRHFDAGEYADTINALAGLVQAGGHDAESLYMGAYSYFMLGDYVRAAQMVENVLNFAPGHIAARILLARICILEDRTDDALALFDYVLEHYEGALTQQQREDVEDILEYYGRNEGERLAKEFPYVAAFLGLTGEAGEAAEGGEALADETPAEDPLSSLSVALDEEPEAATACETAEKESEDAEETAASEAAEEAPDAQEKITEILANNLSLTEKIRVLNAFAGASFVADALADAEAYLRAALEIDATDAGTIRNLAVLLHAMGEQERALTVAAKLPETDFLLLAYLRQA